MIIDGVGHNVTISGAGTVRIFSNNFALTLSRLSLVSGVSSVGGGIANWSLGLLRVINCYFYSNLATSRGGAIYSLGSLEVYNSVFLANSGGVTGGGAISSYSTSFAAPITIKNSTFAGNTAAYGGAWHSQSGVSIPVVSNCVFWGNTAASGGSQMYRAGTSKLPTISYSNIQNSRLSDGNWDTSLGTDGGGNIDADPLFLNAPAGNLRLPYNSPAANHGNTAALPTDYADLDADGNTAEAIPYDMDGALRVVGTVDMGAYEAQLAAITDLKVYKHGVNDIRLTWGSVSGALRYRVLRSENPASGFSAIQELTATEAFDVGALPLPNHYYYKVEGLNP